MTLIFCTTAALTSFSNSVSYITFLFSEWSIADCRIKPGLHRSRMDRKHMFASLFFKLFKYGLVSISF